MSKIAKALMVASKRRKYARGGNTPQDLDLDPSNKGQIPKALQYSIKDIPETWTRQPPQRYADGGSAFDWSGVGEAMPENIGKDKIVDPVANAAVGAVTLYPRYIKSTVDASHMQPGSEEAHEALGRVGDVTGELGMSMLGPKGVKSSGTFASGPMPFSPEIVAKLKGILKDVEAPKPHLEYEHMPSSGTYEVFDPVSGKTHHVVKTLEEAKKLSGAPTAGEAFRKEADIARKDFGRDAKSFEDTYKKFIDDPREMLRQKNGYTTPAYRGLRMEGGEPPDPVHPGFNGGDEYGHMYSTTNPKLAEMYSGYLDRHPGDGPIDPGTYVSGATVAPMFVNTKNYHVYDADSGVWQSHNHRAVEEALKQKKPGVIVKNVWDEPNSTRSMDRPSDVIITFPSGASTVKSKFASKFDPNSPNMLQAKTTGGIPVTEEPEKKAGGGGVGNFNPERAAAFGLARQGMINSDVPGRTDKLNLKVPTGSYVIPADIPSAIGEGNTKAGGSILDKMFTKGPYGMNLSKGKRLGSSRGSSLTKKMRFADGGETPAMDIVAAGGEYLVHPDAVTHLGGGNIDTGHAILDAFVKHVRDNHIQTLKKLKPPKGSE